MFLPELHNLRAIILRYLVAIENRPAPTTGLLGNHYCSGSPIRRLGPVETPAGHDRQTHNPVALALADLGDDWSSPKLAFRAEAQRDAMERRFNQLR